MRRLSVSAKLWLTAGVLTLPLIGLAIFFVKSLTGTLWFTEKEQQGWAIYQPLADLARATGRYGELEARRLANDAPSIDEINRVRIDLDDSIAALVAQDAAQGNPALHANVQAVQNAISSLRSTPASSFADLMRNTAAALDAAEVLRGQIGADWLLALDPEVGAYNLIDVQMTKLPDAARFLSEAHIHVLAMNADGHASAHEMGRALALSALMNDRLNAAASGLVAASQSSEVKGELAHRVAGVGADRFTALHEWTTRIAVAFEGGRTDAASMREISNTVATLSDALKRIQSEVRDSASLALENRRFQEKREAVTVLSTSTVLMLVALFCTRALAGRISGAIKRLLRVTQEIAQGNYNNRIDPRGEDEVSRLFAAIGAMQKRLKHQIETERQAAAATTRIKQALDNVSANVMVTDENYEIIYLNHAGENLFRANQSAFRRDIPHLDAERLVGASVDQFHKNPAEQRQVLAGLTGTLSSDLDIGGKAMRLSASPVTDERGNRIGTVMEWVDRTADVESEQELGAAVRSALSGDLGVRIDAAGKSGFHAAIAQGLNQLLENVEDMVRQVKVSASDVHRGADEISQGTSHLSQRTETQASSLEQTASSMEEMTSTVKQNADNASQANQLARVARDQAETGGAVTAKAVGAMEEINVSSRKIADIIGVIDELSFQTNLLALNAAVEAARAGEQGRGFAVVASEVRNLAGRSAAAARQIKDLIRDSVTKVHDGSMLVVQSGEALERIVSSVKKVSDIVAEIAAASNQQASGIEQVNRAVMQMDEMTQQNAALVEQASAASASMAEQARTLSEMMARYKVGEGVRLRGPAQVRAKDVFRMSASA